MKNSVRFVSVILIILIFSLSFSVHASPLEQEDYKIVAVGIEEHGESGYSAYKVVTAT